MAPLVIKTCPGIVFPGGDFLPLWRFSLFFPFSVFASRWSVTHPRRSRTWSVRTSALPAWTLPPCSRKGQTSSRKISMVGGEVSLHLYNQQLLRSKRFIKTFFFAGCKDSESHISWILCNSSCFFVEAGSLSLHPSPALPLCLPLNQEKCKNNLLWFTRHYAFC